MHVYVYFRVRPCLSVMCVCLCSCVPQDMDILKDLSDTYNNMAEVLDCMEQYSDALPMYQRSLKVCLHICIHVYYRIYIWSMQQYSEYCDALSLFQRGVVVCMRIYIHV